MPTPAHLLMIARHALLPLLGLLLLIGAAACTEAPDDAAPAPSDTRLYPVQQGGQWGYIDGRGDVIIAPQYDAAYAFSEDLALVRRDSLYGYIDRSGEVVIAPQFTDAWYFSDGRAAVKQDGQWGLIDTTGEIVEVFEDSAGAFTDEARFQLDPRVRVERPQQASPLDRVRIGGLYGFRRDGQMAIAPQFEQAWYFAEGRARVREDGQWGYIDTTGAFVVRPRFGRAWGFAGGLALVQRGDRYGYIDTTGAFVWPLAQ